MTFSPSPIKPHHSGARSRVIQGFFPGGKPRVVAAAPAPPALVRPPAPAPVQARRVAAQAPIVPGGRTARAAQSSPGAGHRLQPILPTNNLLHPRTLQAAVPVRPQGHQPVLPHSAAIQPHAAAAFPLPDTFFLRPRGSGLPLPEQVQKKMEAFFKTSFADVRVHVGHEAPSIGALAFTYGSDLYFAPGQYSPQTTQGQQLLGHELTHVVQQRAGRVPNPYQSGVAVVQDPALEAEAVCMGLRAATIPTSLQARAAGGRLPRPSPVIAPVRPPDPGFAPGAAGGAPILPVPRASGLPVQAMRLVSKHATWAQTRAYYLGHYEPSLIQANFGAGNEDTFVCNICSRRLPRVYATVDHIVARNTMKGWLRRGPKYAQDLAATHNMTWRSGKTVHGSTISFPKKEYELEGFLERFAENDLDNLRLTCGPCNSSKNDKLY